MILAVIVELVIPSPLDAAILMATELRLDVMISMALPLVL